MAGPLNGPWARAASSLYGVGWELRRRAYAAGWQRSESVDARVVSIGNLSVGGTGKTTLTLHLAARARARRLDVAVVCGSYRPGPDGRGDEERMYADFVRGDVRHARTKLARARSAVAAGARFILVDDGFSHWRLARDLDVVLLDRTDLWGGGRLLPAGWLREPRRALQRAGLVVVTRLGADESPAAAYAEIAAFAPAARLAAGRHAMNGIRSLTGEARSAQGDALVVTATGNPGAVVTSAREAGYPQVELRAFRDHHWFSPREAETVLAQLGARTLLLTAKDAVRWPLPVQDPRVAVLEVAWQWCDGGEAAESMIFGEGE